MVRQKALNMRILKWKSSKAESSKFQRNRDEELFQIRWIQTCTLHLEWCSHILWAKYVVFIPLKYFWKISSTEKIWSMEKMRKSFLSRLIIKMSAKKRSQFSPENHTHNFLWSWNHSFTWIMRAISILIFDFQVFIFSLCVVWCCSKMVRQ